MLSDLLKGLRTVDKNVHFRCDRCLRTIRVHIKGYLGDADLDWQVFCGCGGRCQVIPAPGAPVVS